MDVINICSPRPVIRYRAVRSRPVTNVKPAARPVAPVRYANVSCKRSAINPVFSRHYSTGEDKSPAEKDAEILKNAQENADKKIAFDGPFPASELLDRPTERVKRLVDEIASLTLIEVAQLCSQIILQLFFTLSFLTTTFNVTSTRIFRNVQQNSMLSVLVFRNQ